MSKLLDFVLKQEQFRRARLPSLFSDFSLQRYTNPDGFTANVSAWQNALQSAAWAGFIIRDSGYPDVLSLSLDEELLSSLESTEWGRPLALHAVVAEAISQHLMVPLEEFLNPRHYDSDKIWAMQPWSLLSWGFARLGFASNRVVTSRSITGPIVLLANVEEAANKIWAPLSHGVNYADGIYSVEAFKDQASHVLGLTGITNRDLSILLYFLAHYRKLIKYDHQTIKFSSPNGELSPLNSEDRTIASLKTLITRLDTQVNQLASREAELVDKSQTAVKRNDRSGALRALRSKKQIEKALLSKVEMLTQLEGIYAKIEQAADQLSVVRVMEASTEVLKSLNAKTGGLEKVENLIDDLHQGILETNEISRVMGSTEQTVNEVDEHDLDEELKALVQQNQQNTEEQHAQKVQELLMNVHSPNDSLPAKDLQEANVSQNRTPSRAPGNTIPVAIDATEAVNRLSLEENQTLPTQAKIDDDR